MPDGRRLVPQDRLDELARMAADGVNEDALFELPCIEMVALLQHIATLGDALDLEAGDYCRVCGCTQNNACEGGCAWADEGLCTSCAEVLDAEEEAKLGPCPDCNGTGDRGELEPWCSRCDGTGKAPARAGDGEGDIGATLATLGQELVDGWAVPEAPSPVTDAVLDDGDREEGEVSVAAARTLVEAGIREALRDVGVRRANVAPLVDRVMARLVGPEGL